MEELRELGQGNQQSSYKLILRLGLKDEWSWMEWRKRGCTLIFLGHMILDGYNLWLVDIMPFVKLVNSVTEIR